METCAKRECPVKKMNKKSDLNNEYKNPSLRLIKKTYSAISHLVINTIVCNIKYNSNGD